MGGKQAKYLRLVDAVAQHVFPSGLRSLDVAKLAQQVNPFAHWHGDVDAKVLVLGETWGNVAYGEANQWRDSDTEQTCLNLRHFLGCAGCDPGLPSKPNPGVSLFLANAVFGIRETGKSGPVPVAWIEDSQSLLRKLLTIVQPEYVVSLGQVAYYALARLQEESKLPRFSRLSEVVDLGCIPCENYVVVPRYHPGPKARRYRTLQQQEEDWRKLAWMLAEK